MAITLLSTSLTVDSAKPAVSADFYQQLLGWEKGEAYGFPYVRNPETGLVFLFVKDDFEYQPPVWPEQEGKQQKQMHFDFIVADLEAAVTEAEKLGAVKAEDQYLTGHGVTMIDPEGRVFDLLAGEE